MNALPRFQNLRPSSFRRSFKFALNVVRDFSVSRSLFPAFPYISAHKLNQSFALNHVRIPTQFHPPKRAHPEDAALGVMRGLTRRIRTLTENVRGLALYDVYTRLAKILHELAVVENDELVIREKVSHQELANQVGSSREMVSKIMKDLATGGYLAIEGKTVHILKPLPVGW